MGYLVELIAKERGSLTAAKKKSVNVMEGPNNKFHEFEQNVQRFRTEACFMVVRPKSNSYDSKGCGQISAIMFSIFKKYR
jgi:hypothetical protein